MSDRLADESIDHTIDRVADGLGLVVAGRIREYVYSQQFEIQRLQARIDELEAEAIQLRAAISVRDDDVRDALDFAVDAVDEYGDCHGEGDGCVACRIRAAVLALKT